MQDFRKLRVWQRAHELTLEIYRITRRFPREELYGLTSQLRRASASVAANLAEGCCRQGDVEFSRFVQISLGSISELDYHLLLSSDLGILPKQEHERLVALLVETRKMMISLIQRLRRGRPVAQAASA